MLKHSTSVLAIICLSSVCNAQSLPALPGTADTKAKTASAGGTSSSTVKRALDPKTGKQVWSPSSSADPGKSVKKPTDQMEPSKKPVSPKTMVNPKLRDAYERSRPEISGEGALTSDLQKDFANYRRQVEIRNPQRLSVDYKANGDRGWTRTSEPLIRLELQPGVLEVKEPHSRNRRVTVEGTDIVVAPKVWTLNVANALTPFETQTPRYGVDREGRRRVVGYDTVRRSDRDATQTLEIGHNVEDQLRLPVSSEILTSNFDVLGTLCEPVPVSGKGPFSTNPNYTSDVLTQYNAIKNNLDLLTGPRPTPVQSGQIASNIILPLRNFCTGSQARANRNAMLTYEDLLSLARTRGAEGASYFAAEDRSDEDGYWSLPQYPAAGIRDRSGLFERGFHSNGVSNDLLSLFTNDDRVRNNGVTIEWYAQPTARKFKRIPLLSTTLVEEAVARLSLKIKRQGNCGVEVSGMLNGEVLQSNSIDLDCPDVDVPYDGQGSVGTRLDEMSNINFTFESKIFAKDDYNQSTSFGHDISSAVRGLGDDEFILYLKARKDGRTDLEVNVDSWAADLAPDPDFRVTGGSFAVAFKLKAGWGNVQQSNGAYAQSLYLAASPVRSPDQSSLLDAEGIEFLADEGWFDELIYGKMASKWRDKHGYDIRYLFREEAGKALTEFISDAWDDDPEAEGSGQYYDLLDNIRSENGFLQECAGARYWTCINLEQYVRAIEFPEIASVPGPFGPLELNISGAKLAEGLIGSSLRSMPIRFVKSLSCKPSADIEGCYEVLGLAIEPKSPLSSNKLWDNIIPFPKEASDITALARMDR